MVRLQVKARNVNEIEVFDFEASLSCTVAGNNSPSRRPKNKRVQHLQYSNRASFTLLNVVFWRKNHVSHSHRKCNCIAHSPPGAGVLPRPPESMEAPKGKPGMFTIRIAVTVRQTLTSPAHARLQTPGRSLWRPETNNPGNAAKCNSAQHNAQALPAIPLGHVLYQHVAVQRYMADSRDPISSNSDPES